MRNIINQDQMKQVNEFFHKEWNVYDPNADKLPIMDGIPRLKSNTPFAKLTKSTSNNYSIKKGQPRQETLEDTLDRFELLIESFHTKQEMLDQFKQNDEKEYDGDGDEM